MLKIYLARHGQDEDNANGLLNGRRDMPLTQKGVAQANEVAQKIKETDIRFDKIYSSPLQRAHKTAQIIAETLGMEAPEVLPNLIERDFGVMAGTPTRDVEATCAPAILRTDTIIYFLDKEGAETFPQMIERANLLLEDLRKKHADGNILLVTHGDFGKMLYAAYYHLDWQDVLKMFHFGNSELLELSENSKPEDTHVFKIQQHNT